jgi:hypothetical protein
MSGFIGAALPRFGIAAKDGRLHPSFMAMADARARGRNRYTPANEGFYSGFWPRSNGFMGDMGADVSMMAASGGRKTELIGAGMASRVGFPGVTRDQYGAPLAACTVILHRTATREFVYEGVSGADGAFLAQSVYAGENHYIVFHKAGAINVYGATDNNLVGA